MSTVPDMLEVASKGTEALEDDARISIANFASSCLDPDGGFIGRKGGSDIYYTMFGILMQLALAISPDSSTSRYVESLNTDNTGDLVHLSALARCRALLGIRGDLDKKIIARIESFRSRDGLYSHFAPNAQAGTVYGTYLASLAYSALRSCDPPRARRMFESVAGLMMPDGSFSNDLESASGGTASTAAAAVMLFSAGRQECRRATEVLISRELPSGGFAPAASPMLPDLLSTATALYALSTCGKEPLARHRHKDFIQSLWNHDGGFSGHQLDNESDCEYSFYALLALGNCRLHSIRHAEMAGTDSFGYAPAISPHRLPRLRSQRGSRGVLKLALE